MDIEVLSAPISAGTTISSPVKIGVKTIVGFTIPATYASGALTFRASVDGGVTFLSFVDTSNNPITIAAPSAGTFINVNPSMFSGVNELEIVCASAPSSNVVIEVVIRPAAF